MPTITDNERPFKSNKTKKVIMFKKLDRVLLTLVEKSMPERGQEQNIIKMIKKENLGLRILNPEMLLFKFEEEIEIYSDLQRKKSCY